MSQLDRGVKNRGPSVPPHGLFLKASTGCWKAFGCPLPGLSVLLLTIPAFAADDIAELRRQLLDQQALIHEQRESLQAQQQKLEAQNRQLDQQQQQLDRLTQRLNSLLPKGTGGAAVAAAKPDSEDAITNADRIAIRDDIGDLNSEAVRTGDFPGSFRIPGPGDISLRIGGFVKTVAIVDSHAERMGADFLPALLGTSRPEDDGAFSVDSTLTRLILDARAPTPAGQLQGYIEADLNDKNDGDLALNLRHAFGLWRNEYGTLLAGQTWSTLMDLKIMPEGLTEPTVSGVIFQRQPMVRWSQPLPASFKVDFALEDPNSQDLFNQPTAPFLANTRYPDVVLGLEYDQPGDWHLRLTTVARDFNINVPEEGRDDKRGWGAAFTGHVSLLRRDRVMFSSVYGEAMGRYLLGLQSTSGGAIEPGTGEISKRDNWGGMVAYEHHWSDTWRSTAMAGYAKSDPLDWQPGDTFKSSTYASVNLMWQAMPYLNVGVEYGYGAREQKDGSDFDNHRVALGFQFF